MDQALWALGRGTGVTAVVFMTLSVTLGIATRSGRPMLSLPRFGVADVHRSAALIGTGLVTIHVLSLLADPYAQLRLIDYIVPFLGAYKPVWLGLGTLAFDVLIIVVLTALMRHRMGVRTFRVVHWSSYGLWPLAVAHSLGNGTDSGRGWFLAVAAACVLLVVAAGSWRLRAGFVEYAAVRTAARRS